nr:hypothetical protein [Fimbriimonadaceae bacterium]
TIEENVRSGGFGQTVRDLLVEEGSGVKHKLVALPDEFIEHGPQTVIRSENGLSAGHLVELILASGLVRKNP